MKTPDNKPLEGLIWAGEEVYSGRLDHGLIVSAGHLGMCITPEKRYVFANHADSRKPIRSFCIHDGTLYYAVGGAIYDAIEEEEIQNRDGTIYSLESHAGKLYDASTCQLLDKLSGRKVTVNCILETHTDSLWQIRNEKIFALKSHNDMLWDAGDYPKICTNSGITIDIPVRQVTALERRGTNLYYASGYEVYELGAQNNKPICERTDKLLALCAYKGKLLNAGCERGIFDSEAPIAGEAIYKFKEEVFAIKSIPMTIWEKLAEKKKAGGR